MSKCNLFVVCLMAYLTSCLASDENCSRLDMLESLLDKIVRAQLKVEHLETKVNKVDETVDNALKSFGNQLQTLDGKIITLNEDTLEKLDNLDEKINYTGAVTRKLAELGISLDSPLTTCEDGWVSFQGSCYYFGTVNVPFADAQRMCDEARAHLVNIEASSENYFLREQLRERNAEKHWIGMSDEAVEGVWRFVPSNKLVTFFEWGANQPNNGRISNCMAIWKSFGYLWVDEPCRNKFRPICEKKNKSD